MTNFKTVKIGDIAKHRKGFIVIQNNKDYKLCRVQLHRKGIVLREILTGYEIKTKKQQVCKKGDLVVAEMDAKFGGYGFINEDMDGAIVSSHYYLYELDSAQILQDYFTVLIHSGLIQEQIEAKGSTNYSSIRAWEFLNYTIPLPDLDFQKLIARRFFSCYKGKRELDALGDHQLKLFKSIRQQVLQDAIEGKLTVNWRKQNHALVSGNNHASKLLERTKAEKESLIKEGKIKRDKPLLPISDNEKPFDLPDGWTWCRLGDISNVVRGGSPRPAGSKQFYDGTIPFLKVGDLTADTGIYLNKYSHTIKEAGLHKTRYVEANTLMLTNSGATLGIPKICTFPTTFNDGIAAFLGLHKEMSQEYLYFFLKAKSSWFLSEAARGQGQPNLNTDIIGHTILGLPPFLEQKVIGERLNNYMSMIDELEKQVTDRKNQSEMLMKSVLREVFVR